VLESKAREIAQIRELDAHLPGDGLVWTLGFTGPIETYTSRRARDLWQVSTDEIKSNPNSYLFLDVQNIKTQWRGREPDALYQSLLESNSLEAITEIRNWTLYRIR
jgi:hypothetical protein